MSDVVAGMTVSIDGYVEDPDGRADPLYPDLAALRGTPYMEELVDATGAVLMGRRAFEMAEDPDWYAGNYELQCPIFVLTHHPPERHPKETDELTFTFLADGIEAAVDQAKAAAGARAVHCVGGPDVTRQLLQANLVDELHVDVMPVVLGGGRRFLDDVGRRIDLEKIGVLEVGQRTSLRFRVER